MDEAHRHGLPVTAHAHGTDAVAGAVVAGVEGVEHVNVTFFTETGVETPDPLIRLIAERGIVVGATIGALPSALRGAVLLPAVALRLDAVMANYRRFVEAGARLVAATDAGLAHPPSRTTWCGKRRQGCASSGSARRRRCSRSRRCRPTRAVSGSGRDASPPATTPTSSLSTAIHSPIRTHCTESGPSTPGASPSRQPARDEARHRPSPQGYRAGPHTWPSTFVPTPLPGHCWQGAISLAWID